MVWFYILLVIFILPFLLYLDYYFGKRSHHNNVKNHFFSITTGDSKLYHSGGSLFNDMFQEIQDAKKEVCVEFFIVKNDSISKELLFLLKKKALGGVTVRLLVDRVGGYKLTYGDRHILKNTGIDFAFSERLGFPFFFYRLNRRNHRKITVIDGKVGYVGGFNIGDEYVSKDPKFQKWRDYHLRLSGEIVRDLQRIFQDDWQKAAKGPIKLYQPRLKKQPEEFQVVATDGLGLEDMLYQFINHAKKEILIGTPYFIPSKIIFDVLLKAIERGVVVKLLVPMKSDHPFVKEAGIPYYRALKEKGAEVRLFDLGFYHGKLFMVDEKICDIGTANFDRRSFFINKEVNIIGYDANFIAGVRETFLKDFEEGIALTDNWINQLSWWMKVKISVARLLRPLL